MRPRSSNLPASSTAVGPGLRNSGHRNATAQQVAQPARRSIFVQLTAEAAETMPVVRRAKDRTSFGRKIDLYLDIWKGKAHTAQFGFQAMHILL